MKIELINFSKNNEEQLTSVLGKFNLTIPENKKYVFFYINNEDENDRYLLRERINKGEDIVIFSHSKEYAYLAWRSNAVGFIMFPLDEMEIAQLLIKLKSQTIENPLKNKFSFRQQDGTHVIDCDSILYIEAKGDYSVIYLNNNQRILLTKQLHEIQKGLINVSYLVRFGRSWILNIKTIKTILTTDKRKESENFIKFNREQDVHRVDFSYDFCSLVRKYILFQDFM